MDGVDKSSADLVIVLANSRKLGGRCVAGIDLNSTWVRPVSNSATGELRPPQYVLDDGSGASVMDLVRMPLGRVLDPKGFQPENRLLAETPWELVARPSPAVAARVLQAATLAGPDLLGGPGDHLPHSAAIGVPTLVLIAPTIENWLVGTTLRGNPQARVVFTVDGQRYNLVVTDVDVEKQVKALGLGRHDPREVAIGRCANPMMTVSLGEPMGGQCYKLAAAIFEPPWPAVTPAPQGPPPAVPGLRDALRSWRRKRADADGVPAFVVFHDSTLEELVRRVPTTEEALLRCPGFGPVKVERYAPELLPLIRSFLHER